MKKDDILKKVTEITIDKLALDISYTNENSNFVNDLGCDSLDCIEIIMEFEREFDIAITDERAEKVKTVSDSVDLIYDLLN